MYASSNSTICHVEGPFRRVCDFAHVCFYCGGYADGDDDCAGGKQLRSTGRPQLIQHGIPQGYRKTCGDDANDNDADDIDNCDVAAIP